MGVHLPETLTDEQTGGNEKGRFICRPAGAARLLFLAYGNIYLVAL